MNRRLPLALVAAGALVLAACGGDDEGSDATEAPTTEAPSTDDPAACAEGKTLDDGVLTIATGNPAFSPWVENDAPESGEGFEAAVAYAVAEEMGFTGDAVTWVRTTFDEAIQPGAKNFDFNLQQYSITEERAANITFSEPYYATNQAIVAFPDSAVAGAATLDDLKGLKFGAQAGTTSLEFITDIIQPDSEPYIYDDNVGAKAALEADQIDAIVVDLPTAYYISAVEIEGSTVIAQFPFGAGGIADEFGMVFEQGNPLVECVNAALANLTESGELAQIEQTWLADQPSSPPVIPVD